MMNNAQMITLARRQVALARALDPDAPIGGHLVAATITERGTTIRTLADLEVPELVPVSAPSRAQVAVVCHG